MLIVSIMQETRLLWGIMRWYRTGEHHVMDGHKSFRVLVIHQTFRSAVGSRVAEVMANAVLLIEPHSP